LAQAVLREGDTIEIRLNGVPSEDIQQFSQPYTVDEKGMLNLPYIGQVRAAGLAPNVVQSNVESMLRDQKIFTHPTVTINIQPTSRFISVGGAVRQPGRVPFTADLTLMSAINAAGGFNDFANPRKVRLVRGGKATVYDAVALRKDPSGDPRILPGDQIDVPLGGFF
jgi:polysaccharide export outer membrane protein